MFLSELKINGFKSFANKTDLKFSKGMTCIIGPNGCGKSNIVDAIRWVIGEQRASAIRSDKMTDVIFSGTHQKKPLGMADVSLTIINDKGILPSEYNEVVVTRRVFRSGQSEYLLNGVSCRMKDIQDLFMDKGMGSGAYSVIELKMVEQILSNNNTDRRLLFEEAAGIKKYKLRRNSAQKKLEDTRQDLLRVHDIAEEVRKTVTSLSRQVAKVNRYRALKEELLALEINSAIVQYINLKNEVLPLQEKLGQLHESQLVSGKQLSLDEAVIESYKLELHQKEDELAVIRKQLFEKEEHIRLIHEKELLSKEKIKNSASLIERLEHDILDIEKRKQTATTQIQEKRISLESVQERRETFNDRFQRVEDDYNEVLENHQTSKTELSSLQDSYKKVHQEASKLNTEIDQLKYRTSDLEHRIASLKTVDTDKITQLEARKSEAETKINASTESICTLQERIETLVAQHQETLSKQKEVTQEKSELEKSFLQLESKRNILEDTLLSGSLHPEEIQRFLNESYQFESFVGLLSDIIDVNVEEKQSDIAQLLQQFASLPIFRGISAEEHHLLKESFPKLKLFLIPETFETVTPHEYSLANHLYSTLLTEDECLYLFGKWLYIKNDENVTRYAGRDLLVLHPTEQYNDLERTLQLKTKNDDGVTLIGAQHQIDKLDEELENLQEKLDKKEEFLFEIEDKIQHFSTTKEAILVQISEKEKDANRFQGSLNQIQFEINHYHEQLANSEAEIATFTAQLTELNQHLLQKQPRFEGFIVEEAELEEKMKQQELDVENLFKKQQQEKDRLTELQLEQKTLESEENALKETLRREYYFLKDADGQIEVKRNEIESLQNQKENFGEESDSRKNVIETLQNEKESILNLKAKVEDEFTTLRERINSTEKQIKENRTKKESLQTQAQQYELKIKELFVKSQSVAEHAQKEHQMDITDKDRPENFNLLHAEKEIFDIRGKIASLGEVNALAIEEHTKEKERLDFLETQLQDIHDAEAMLADTIKTINNTAKDQFQNVFDEIRSNFQTVFNQFFQNGEADLVLHQADDPLEGKIEINVRPKGRALQTLALMSGGEKTLTAISLLFAIYLVKPSPFCILDEVDAPLDDVNIKRFTSALKNFTDRTQFIIVTHNKLTMEAADTMYGVTQENVGISKLVSVKFD